MKHPFALLALFLAAAPAFAADWTPIPTGTTATIRSLRGHFTAPMIVGDSGFVAQSDAGITTFTPQASGTSARLLTVLSAGPDMASGAGGTFRVHIGTPWFSRPIPDAAEDFVICSRRNDAAYAGGSGGSIYYTNDEGVTWKFEGRPTTFALHAGADGTRFVGDHGTLVQTIDQGVHWTTIPTGTTANLYALLDDNTATILAVGEGGLIALSLDDGASWTYPASGTTETLRAIDYSEVSSGYLVAVGDHGTVISTTDGGATWCTLDAGTTANLYAVSAITNSEFLVAGEGGLVLKTTNAGGTCTAVAAVGDEPERPTGALALAGPFPAPLRARGTFAFSARTSGVVRVDLLDVNGRALVRLYDGPVAAGERRTVALESAGLSPGVYYVRACSGAETSTRGFVILR